MEYSQHPDSKASDSDVHRLQAGRRKLDPSLYLVINPDQCASRDPVQTAVEAVQGGATAVQIRAKGAPRASVIDLAQQISAAVRNDRAAVFVNDLADLDPRTAIDGVHLGQSDTPVTAARRRLGSHFLIGLTVRSMSEAAAAPLSEIDYVSIGGVFPTRSKTDADRPIGLDKLSEIASAIRARDANIAIIAISGINQTNLASVMSTGIDGVAVVSAICEANDPRRAAQLLRDQIALCQHRYFSLLHQESQ